MLFRVDYLLALIVAGAIAGALAADFFANIETSRLARAYYVLIAVRVTLGITLFVLTYVLPVPGPWSSLSKLFGDGTNFLLGALFGLVLRRSKPPEILLEPQVYSALCLSAGYSILIAGVGKAFSMQAMTDFFTQSGYSISFLKFIMVAEIIGGAALLIPWATLPAAIGISVDMMGAVITHVHNGDPLNDSTGAIAMLFRLAAIAVVWSLRPRSADPPRPIHGRLATVTICAALCLVAAIAGSSAMRHATLPPTMGSSNH
jgi:uncharacterized membrane protein YphA (DoxX/SURF4 family)